MAYVSPHDGEVCLGGAYVPPHPPPPQLRIDPHHPSSFAILAAPMRVKFAIQEREAA
jgi:hypothetical protein